MSKSRRSMAMAGILLGVIVFAVAALAWRAGGPQELREISYPVAVPELPR